MGDESRKLSERVIATVADVLDADPMDLPPLEIEYARQQAGG